MKHKFIGCFNKSVLLTYVGIFISFLGMITLFSYEDTSFLSFPMVCLIFAGICDLFDGVVARKFNRNQTQKQFGIQIDSFADIISFLVFPTLILYKIIGQANIYLYIVVSFFYLICGITRLSWFNIHTDGHTDYYSGLPVTYAALILPILYKIFYSFVYCDIFITIIYVLIAFFFVLNIKIKKPKGIWYVIFPLLAIVMLLNYLLSY